MQRSIVIGAAQENPIGEFVIAGCSQKAKTPVADGIKMELAIGVLAGIVLGSLLSWGKERKR